jgi:hypothetical protein
MHGFSGLFGLPRQLIELCQSIICRVGLHMPGDYASENHQPSYRAYGGPPEGMKTTCDPVRAAEPQDLRPSDAVTETASNCA